MLSDVRAVISFHDAKKKRNGGGGLSDGGLAQVRQSLSTQSVLIGPSKGKAWQAVPGSAEEAEMGLFVVNFDSVDAHVEIFLVLEDEVTEIPQAIETVADLTAGPIELPTMLAYPMKLRVKLSEAHTDRVLLAGMFTEFDLPKE